MSFESLWALAVFAFISSITPGPNNLMLLASGLNFGVRRTLPHMLGVSVGFGIMLVLVGLGLAAAFAAYPIVYRIMQWLGVAYLLYLAYAIAHSAPLDLNNEINNETNNEKNKEINSEISNEIRHEIHANSSVNSSAKPGAKLSPKPMSFLGACAFQWINPKAWIMGLTAFSTYAPAQASLAVILIVALLFTLVNFPSVSLWALFGARMRLFLQDAKKRRWFNWGMAAALVATVLPMLKF